MLPVAIPDPRRSRRRLLRFALALIVLGSCAFAVLAATDQGDAARPADARTPAAAKVLALSETVTVAPVDLAETLPVTGEVKALRRVALSAQVGGIADDVTHLPGQPVARGDLLLSIAEQDHRLALQAAEAERDSLAAQRDVARSTLTRTTRLAASGARSGATLEQDQSAVAVLEASVAAADIRVRQAGVDLDRARIAAPIAGTLASRSVEPGQLVQAGDALFEIVDLADVTVEAMVPLGQAARLRRGQDAVLWAPDAPARRITAKVARIAPQAASGTRSVAVWLDIDNSRAGLRVGSFLKGEITLHTASARIALPQAALRDDSSVLVIRDGLAVAVPVTAGPMWHSGALVEVAGGLRPGERVVALPLQGLDAGDAVHLGGQ